MLKIGLSSCKKELSETLFQEYRRAGIELMEISATLQESEALDFARLAALGKQYGVTLWSLHLPFGPFDVIDVSRPSIADQSIHRLHALIKRAAAVGIDKFIIHPSGEPIPDADRPTRMTCARESLARLAELTAREGGTLAVENLPRTCLGKNSAEILELVSAHPALRVCFDTNHLLGEEIEHFVRAVGDKIVTTHVSDYDRIDERHWMPGEGVVDWPSLLRTLDEIGYRGAWLYEFVFECPQGLHRGRDLTCADVARNAHELFAGKEITLVTAPCEL